MIALRDTDGAPILEKYVVPATTETAESTEYCVQPVSYTAVTGVAATTNPVDGRTVWPIPLQGAWITSDPGNGRGGWLPRVRVGTGWNAMTALAGPGDLTGDGKADLLARDTLGQLWLYPGNGPGGWLPRVRVGTGWNAMTALAGPGDLTGDGKADLLARDTLGQLWLYPGNGRGGWLPRVRVGTGWSAMTALVS